MSHGSQIAYWNGIGAAKTFTHPVNLDWLTGLAPEARVLDYGCGYGRVMAELGERGFRDVTGVDLSPALIERGRRLHPGLRISVLESPPHMPVASGSFDAVLLFAVLTCIPDDLAQRSLIREISRVLAVGGLLYISDMILQDDTRNQQRYSAYAAQHDVPYGVCATDDGAVVRHHDIAPLRRLLVGFDLVDEQLIEVKTMNGHASRAVQLLACKQ